MSCSCFLRFVPKHCIHLILLQWYCILNFTLEWIISNMYKRSRCLYIDLISCKLSALVFLTLIVYLWIPQDFLYPRSCPLPQRWFYLFSLDAFYFLSLNRLARTSSTMLSRNSESRHLTVCLLPGLGEKNQCFTIKYNVN